MALVLTYMPTFLIYTQTILGQLKTEMREPPVGAPGGWGWASATAVIRAAEAQL